MKAVVFHGIGDIRLKDVKEPTIKELNDSRAPTRGYAPESCSTVRRYAPIVPSLEPPISMSWSWARP